jgi:hypothetical protein
MERLTNPDDVERRNEIGLEVAHPCRSDAAAYQGCGFQYDVIAGEQRLIALEEPGPRIDRRSMTIVVCVKSSIQT